MRAFGSGYERMTLTLKDPELLRTENFIGGSWCKASDGATAVVTNPATGKKIASVPKLSRADVARAISAASEAQPGWATIAAQDRARILVTLRKLMDDHVEDLATIITSEQGKPIKEARSEVAYAGSYLTWFAEEARRIYGETIPSPWPGRKLIVQRQPVGVFAAITPWNFPLAMLVRKVAAGWAAGCAGIVRPDLTTPLSALAFAVLAERAGIPPGVCNVVTGDPHLTGLELCENPAVRKLSFTGSTRVGAILLAQCAPTIKRTSMELGGNAPFIVFDDANLDAAIEGAIAAKFRNAGQTCVCANRFLVQSGVYDEFAQRLTKAVAGLTLGDGMNAATDIGPLHSEASVRRMAELVKDATERGARVLTPPSSSLSSGFFSPTVVCDVEPSARLFHEEIFGPVAGITKFNTEAEAIALANASEHGLASYFYSRDIGRIFRVTDAIEAGMVGINTGQISSEVAPFGGIKSSGSGREGSRHGIEDYLELKYLCIGGLDE